MILFHLHLVESTAVALCRDLRIPQASPKNRAHLCLQLIWDSRCRNQEWNSWPRIFQRFGTQYGNVFVCFASRSVWVCMYLAVAQEMPDTVCYVITIQLMGLISVLTTGNFTQHHKVWAGDQLMGRDTKLAWESETSWLFLSVWSFFPQAIFLYGKKNYNPSVLLVLGHQTCLFTLVSLRESQPSLAQWQKQSHIIPFQALLYVFYTGKIEQCVALSLQSTCDELTYYSKLHAKMY